MTLTSIFSEGCTLKWSMGGRTGCPRCAHNQIFISGYWSSICKTGLYSIKSCQIPRGSFKPHCHFLGALFETYLLLSSHHKSKISSSVWNEFHKHILWCLIWTFLFLVQLYFLLKSYEYTQESIDFLEICI